MSCAREELRDAVDNAEVHGLAWRRMSGVTDASGTPNTCEAVTAWKSSPERNASLHARIVRDMRQHAQLDLAVVRVDQYPARARDEHAANLAAQLRAHRDILQDSGPWRKRRPVAVTVFWKRQRMRPSGPMTFCRPSA